MGYHRKAWRLADFRSRVTSARWRFTDARVWFGPVRWQAARRTPGFDAAAALGWTWARVDPDGWFRPWFAARLGVDVASGRRTAVGAWRSWTNNPRQDRYARRRADTLRRLRRLDGPGPTRIDTHPRFRSARHRRYAATAHIHRASVRLWTRVAWWMARDVEAHDHGFASAAGPRRTGRETGGIHAAPWPATDAVDGPEPSPSAAAENTDSSTPTGGASAADADRR